MTSKINRRNLVQYSALAGCALLLFGKLSAVSGFDYLQNEIPDPKKLEYCGHTCPKDCQFLEASVENDVKLKRKAYETWKMKKRFGVDFDADKIFCFGCKNPDKPVGIRLQRCDVRQCAIQACYSAKLAVKYGAAFVIGKVLFIYFLGIPLFKRMQLSGENFMQMPILMRIKFCIFISSEFIFQTVSVG